MTVEKCAKNYCQVSVALNKSRKLPTYAYTLYNTLFLMNSINRKQNESRQSSIYPYLYISRLCFVVNFIFNYYCIIHL